MQYSRIAELSSYAVTVHFVIANAINPLVLDLSKGGNLNPECSICKRTPVRGSSIAPGFPESHFTPIHQLCFTQARLAIVVGCRRHGQPEPLADL